MNPLLATAALMHHKNEVEYFVGTAFSYKSEKHFITANHCMPKDLGSVTLAIPTAQKVLTVSAIARHETADLALLYCDHPSNNYEGIESFTAIDETVTYGTDFMTFGFPEDFIGPNAGNPTPRLFKGYFQTLFNHNSHMGYKYKAGELSIPCPHGLSGAPLFHPDRRSVLSALVTENIETSTEMWSETIEEKGSSKSEHTYNRVINYGVSVILHHHKEWIEEHINNVEKV